jgi:hypothetical protein
MSVRTDDRKTPRYSRRQFLTRLGIGTAVAGSTGFFGGYTAEAVQTLTERIRHEASRSDRFGRIFPRLRPFAEPSTRLTAALLDIGKPGGVLDANDDLTAGPLQLLINPALQVNNPNNPNHTAGTTFMGQFMDHDMTFDQTSRLGVPTRPERSENTRTPVFDLDSVYGGGPLRSPHLYQHRDRAKFVVESGGQFEDLPRDSSLRAIIPDPRNDENIMIAGLHAAVMLFHNRAVDMVRLQARNRRPERGFDEIRRTFDEARRLTRWHYQWMILHEFLPLFVGQEMVTTILARGRRFYEARRGDAVMPVEFQGAAYRFGHSMVRPSYGANPGFVGFVFDASQDGMADPNDLRGGARAPRRFIAWQRFFDFGDGLVGRNKRIDGRISSPLFRLPLFAIASGDPPTALPQRNLLRQVTWLLPSGQSIAREMRVDPLPPSALPELEGYGLGLERHTPLWYYVLREAEIMAQGLTLGPVGGRIVGEVIVGLLQSDPESFLSRRNWTPEIPQRNGGTGDFRMADFLTFAGVDPTSRGG